MAHNLTDKEVLIDAVNRCNRLAERIALFESMDETFHDDLVLMDAIIFNVVALGSTVSKLSDAFNESHPELHCQTLLQLSEQAILDTEQLDFKAFYAQGRHKVPFFRTRLLKALEDEFGYTMEDAATENTGNLF